MRNIINYRDFNAYNVLIFKRFYILIYFNQKRIYYFNPLPSEVFSDNGLDCV